MEWIIVIGDWKSETGLDETVTKSYLDFSSTDRFVSSELEVIPSSVESDFRRRDGWLR